MAHTKPIEYKGHSVTCGAIYELKVFPMMLFPPCLMCRKALFGEEEKSILRMAISTTAALQFFNSNKKRD